jgi:hypothetical protein
MSNPSCQTAGMKMEKSSWFQRMTGETFATFGTAPLSYQWRLDDHDLSGQTSNLPSP